MAFKMRCMLPLVVISVSATAHADQVQRTTVSSIAGRISNGSYSLVASGGLLSVGQALGGGFAESDGFLAPGGPPPLPVPWASNTPPTRTRIVLLGPNPFHSRVTCFFEAAISLGEAAEHASMEIFDLTGRRVNMSTRPPDSPGTYLFEWNGMDSRGTRLPAGVYLTRFRAGSQIKSGRLILLD